MKISKMLKEKASKGMGTAVATISETKPAGTTEFYGAHQVAGGVTFVAFYPQARTVQLAGDFNNWRPEKNPMQKIGDGTWQAKLSLAKGVYRYRLVVDGRWQHDPYNKMTEPNPYGELNSVLKVN